MPVRTQLTPTDTATIRRLLADGASVNLIVKRFHLGRPAVERIRANQPPHLSKAEGDDWDASVGVRVCHECGRQWVAFPIGGRILCAACAAKAKRR